MNKEVKEIIEDVKRHLDYVEKTKQCFIRDGEMKVMYDCIINLQEESEREKQFTKDCGFVNQQQLALAYLDYGLRIDKALKCIDEKIKSYGFNNVILLKTEYFKELKDILEGSDKSE